MTDLDNTYQVVIVGGGPVGVALAVELGQRGISCAVVERRLEPQRIPKGQNLTQRTLEHFYFWNCVDELRAARLLPPGYPIGGITAYRNLMSDSWFHSGGRDAVRNYFFQANDRLPQYLTEEVLRTRLRQLPKVTTFFGWAADEIDQDDSCVRVRIREESGAQTRLLSGEYLVGCDGARSGVREQLGIDRGGRDFDERMVLAVFRSRELHALLERFPPRTTYRVLHPDLKGYWQFFGRIDVGEGWFFHAPVPSDTTQDNYDFLGLIQRVAGVPVACDFDYVGFWDLRISVAGKYHVGRSFIAGDAAHSHPPYGGFGLNSGLEDVTNLGWKLAAVLRGWGGQALLDSYTEERQPVFVETGEAMIAGGIELDRAFLERYSPERDDAEFAAAWRQLGEGGGWRQQAYEPHYEGSSVVAGPPGAKCSIHGKHSFAARAGHHLAPRVLTNGRNVFEELGCGFTLLAFDADDAAVEGFEAGARALGAPLQVVRDTFAEDRRAYEAKLVLVRPDQYVVWAANEPPADIQALLCMATGTRC